MPHHSFAFSECAGPLSDFKFSNCWRIAKHGGCNMLEHIMIHCKYIPI